MSNVKISQLPSATTPLGGTEVLPIVQSGATKKVTVANLRGTVVTAVTGTAPVVSSGGTTPAISMAAANGSTNGYLTSTDWTTFNGKQPAGSYLTSGGALGTPSSGTATNLTGLPLTTGVTGILPVANGGSGTATPALVAGSNVTISGSWPNQTINSTAAGTGTVTSVATGVGLTGGPITTSGTIDLANTAVTPGAYTAANITVDAQGRITAAANGGGGSGTVTSVAATVPSFLSVTGSPITTSGTLAIAYSGTALPIANGGTGQTTAAAAITALTGSQTSGQYLRSDGTNAALAAIQAGDVPTLNQNTTGTAANVTGTVAVANGGTGAATLTANNVLLGNGTSAPLFVAPGSNGNVLTSNGTTWASSTPTAQAYPGAGIANSTGSAWGTSYTTTGSGTVVALATSPSFTTPVLGTPTSGTLSNCTVDGTNSVGFLNIPQNSQSAAYTLVAADAGKHILHPSTDANARTFTIPANSSVPFAIGTAVTFVNMTSQVVTIAITSDTLTLSPAGTSGSRSLAQYGSATALKIGSTQWLISGSGLT